MLAAAPVRPARRTLPHGAFTVGWICALRHELKASVAALDELYTDPKPDDPHDDNAYVAGRIGEHNVIMACLPGKYGTSAAAVVATNMARTFASIRHRVLVGIGGGVPSKDHDIKLGDVVVSVPAGGHGGVVQYDMGKEHAGTFHRKGHLAAPSSELLSVVQRLHATDKDSGLKLQVHLDSIFENLPADVRPSYLRPDPSDTVPEEGRHTSSSPVVHYGLIASGNKVIADAAERDRLRREVDILCFEMEAAGLMDSFQCLVVRGICDYADKDKDDTWQCYAAAVAAAYTKQLLLTVPRSVGPDQGSRYRLSFFSHAISSCKIFVGRESELRQMRLYFDEDGRTSQTPKIFIISAMGGMGKTTLCANYVLRHQHSHDSIIWINGWSLHAVQQSFREVAARIPSHAELPAGFGQSGDVDVVLSWLSLKDNQNWLLVFDNVDLDCNASQPDPHAYDIDMFIPKVPHGAVLITSRLKSLHKYGKLLILEELTRENAISLLRGWTAFDLDPSTDIDETLRLLNGLPLALTLAGSFIAENSLTLAQYNKIYKEQYHELVQLQDSHGSRELGGRHGFVTWMLSYNQVKNECPDAVKLLELWSCLAASGFNHSSVEPAAKGETCFKGTPDWLRTVSQNPLRFKNTMSWLRRYSMAEKSAASDDFAVHAVLHDWCFQMLLLRDPQLCIALCGIAATLIASHGRQLVGQGPNFPKRLLLLHCGALSRRVEAYSRQVSSRHTADTTSIASYYVVAKLICAYGSMRDILSILRYALSECESTYGPTHRTTIYILGTLGDVHMQLQDLEAAETFFSRAVRASEPSLGALAPATIRAKICLAWSHIRRRRLDAADATLTHLSQHQDRLSAEDAREALISRSFLLAARGQAAAARHTRETAVLPGAATPLHALQRGQHFHALADLAAARAHFERAYTGYLAARGPDATTALYSLDGLALCTLRTGDHAAALPLYRLLLQRMEKHMGAAFAQVPPTQRLLAECLAHAGELAEARALLGRALAACEAAGDTERGAGAAGAAEELIAVCDALGRQDEVAALRERYVLPTEPVVRAQGMAPEAVTAPKFDETPLGDDSVFGEADVDAHGDVAGGTFMGRVWAWLR